MTAGLQGITVVGGVVPPVLLGRIQSGEVRDANSLRSASYHLIGTETTRDAASRAWSYLRGAWEAWRAADQSRTPGTPGTGAAREKWLLPLLRELGYGQVQAHTGSVIIDDREYPISHQWNHVAIHLLGPGVDLDRRNPGVAGAARAPQAMIQEYLNRSPEHLWAILSNGLQIRLLRDSTALAGSAYLEFDLETIFDGELYPEFLLFWQLAQFSRLEKRGGPDKGPEDCWLESWRGEAVDAGTRALDKLRDGVETALKALGSGVLKHPNNRWLTQSLHDGELTDREFHKALLRTVYRLLFCFVAEDRGALLDPTAPAEAGDRYLRYFSTARLRRLSRRRAGGPHPDLWQAQKLVLRALGGSGRPEIAVPALGGLFDPDSREHVVTNQPANDLILSTEIANADLLTAVRALAWVTVKASRIQPVDYRHLGAEELGSVYESLLELIPRVNLDEKSFTLEQLSGNERKTTGSYYTPPALVSALLDSALDPVLDDAVKNADSAVHAEQRLLALTVCDPACGSGGFLVAASRRIARRLAMVRSGEDEPTPADVQHALHDVVGRCVYGVDLNDLAAELAKVSLWLEALEPGKPLGFLDARIRVGNSLLGTTPALLAGGVPDAAFKEVEGDDKKYAAAIRKRNKEERSGQRALLFEEAPLNTTELRKRRSVLLGAPADQVDQVRTQAQAWEEYEESRELRRRRLHADAWSAAFFWPLVSASPEPPTDDTLRRIAQRPESTGLARTIDEVERLVHEYRFFHWHLEFPEIFGDLDSSAVGADGWPGGFSCLLGNPPWEIIELKEQEFFAARDPEVAAASGDRRKTQIRNLATTDPALSALYEQEKRHIDGIRHFASLSGRYPLTGRGRVKTDPIFAELFRGLTGPLGRTGVIVPTGIATDATTQFFFKDLVATESLSALYDFENAAPLFEGVHRSFKFCLLTIAGRDTHQGAATFAFFLHAPDAIVRSEFALTPDEIRLLNPNTGTLPIFRSRRDAEITLGVYRRVPVLLKGGARTEDNTWHVAFMQGLFNMTSDSDLFKTRRSLESAGWVLRGNIFENGDKRMLPLYEGRMGHQYNHRFASLDTGNERPSSQADLVNPSFSVLPQFWVAESTTETRQARRTWGTSAFMVGHRRVARNNDERTCIASALPWGAASYGWILTTGPTADELCLLLSTSNSFAYDYLLRGSFSQPSLPQSTSEQIAVPTRSSMESFVSELGLSDGTEWFVQRVKELSYTSWDLGSLALELGDLRPPFVWDDERRNTIRCELDAALFHIYGIGRDDLDHIMDTFTIIRRKEEDAFTRYRTKDAILAIFDKMESALLGRSVYRSSLVPEPGQGARHPAKARP